MTDVEVKTSLQEEEEDSLLEPSEQKTYRIASKSLFITWPQCPLSPNEVLKFILLITGEPQLYYISTEDHHTTEGKHIHAYLKYKEKLNIRDGVTTFTLNNTYIPHFAPIKGKNSESRIISYVCKDHHFIHNRTFDMSTPVNYQKNKRDFEEWQADISLNNRPANTYPITLFGQTINKPDQLINNKLNKRRHLWIVSMPDMGKTYTIDQTFKNVSYYLRRNNKFPFEQYNHEELIVYDDVYSIPWSEISTITSTLSSTEQPVPGDVRYKSINFKKNSSRTMIVVSNSFPDYFESKNQEAVAARFQLVILYKSLKKDINGEYPVQFKIVPEDIISEPFQFKYLVKQYNEHNDAYKKQITKDQTKEEFSFTFE